jgi:hypothetical protein
MVGDFGSVSASVPGIEEASRIGDSSWLPGIVRQIVL